MDPAPVGFQQTLVVVIPAIQIGAHENRRLGEDCRLNKGWKKSNAP
ncbi:MAG: hypothetical protein PHV34_16335 [Verrucomicrobiae bacterium]|nr:hypothetical protein [Verrucomicrobiae bacterium]